MRKLTYAVILFFAFGFGLTATIAASRLVVPAGLSSPTLEQPVQAPSGAPKRAPAPTVEC